MKKKTASSMSLVCFILVSFTGPVKAQSSDDFSLNNAGAFENMKTSGNSSAQAAPVPQAVLPEIAGLLQEEVAMYLSEDENLDYAEPKSASSDAAKSKLGGDGVIKLYHQWNKETLEIRYRDAGGKYLPAAMAKIKHLFRCRLTGQEKEVPPALVEILDALQNKFDNKTITIICGFRSSELNDSLAQNSTGVAKNSLHMRGLAADISISGVTTSELKTAAKALKAGGVGYYPKAGFVHVDVGAVRYW